MTGRETSNQMVNGAQTHTDGVMHNVVVVVVELRGLQRQPSKNCSLNPDVVPIVLVV